MFRPLGTAISSASISGFFFPTEHGRTKLQSKEMSFVTLQSNIFSTVGAIGRSALALVPVLSLYKGNIKCVGLLLLTCFCNQTRILL